MRSNKLDAILLLLFPIIAAILTVLLKTNFLVSIFLFFGLPSFYIALRDKETVRRSWGFALIFGSIFYLVLDPLASINNSWIISKTIFPIKFLGIVTVENYIFALLWAFIVVLFYEYFFGKTQVKKIIDPLNQPILYSFISLIILILILFYTKQEWLYIPYFYLVAGVIFAIIPLIIFLHKFPQYLRKFTLVGLYFALLLLLFEIVALHNGQWMFPHNGNFIGFINFFGYTFPIEELIIWVLFATPGLLAWYKFFYPDPNTSISR